MSIFEPATTINESPEMGQEELMAAEQQEMNQQAQEPTEAVEGETVDVEAGADEAQDTGETPSEEGESEQGEQKEQFDFETAYKELRKDYTRKAQELAELKRQMQSPIQQQYGQGQVPDIEQLTNQFWEEFQRDPVNTLYRFADSVAEQRLQSYRQQVEQLIVPIYETQAAQMYAKNMSDIAKQYPDLHTNEGFAKFNEKLVEISQELGNPNMIHNPPKRILDMAAREVFGDSTAKIYQKAKAQGKEEALNNIRTKQGLSTPTGAKLKEQPKTPEELIAENIVNAGVRGGIFG